jgi:hypothetical protein
MRTRARKIDLYVLGTLLVAVSPLVSWAQQPPVAASPSASTDGSANTNPFGSSAPSPAAANPPPANPGSPAPAASAGAGDSSTTSALDYLYNHKAQDGSVASEAMGANAEAKNHALAQDALGTQQIEDPDMRARFERYLGMTEVSQDQIKAYSEDMQTVIDLLHQHKTPEAWQKLYKLAQYQGIDAGVSWELANRIESIWNANQTKYQIAKQNDQLQHDADTADHNADLMSDDIKEQEIDYQRQLHDAGIKSTGQSGGGTNNTGSLTEPGSASMAPPSDEVMGKLQLTEEYLNSLQDQAKIKLNEMKVEKLFDQAKSDFADYITTLYKSGRYQHVLIAADFWRQIFDEGDYPVSMAQQVNASLEANNEVYTTIGVFNNNLDQKNVAAATDNLEQAFMVNEVNPALLGVPLAKKKQVLTFTHELSRMQNIIEARDFTDLESLLAEMKQTAPDFDSVKAMSIVNAVKLDSQLHLGKAKIAAQQHDLKTAMEEFQAAGESWPGNPDLKDKALSFFNAQDVQTQSLDDFDRLVAENNYWAIYDKQLVFAPAMKDDTKRQDQLKAALDKVKIAETAIEKANLMQSNGDVDGAWETVQLAIKDLPEDIKLNSMRGDLAGKAADFVAAINKAQDAEAKQELGYSLSWYAVAQRAYPASLIANQAIDRLSKGILAKSAL